MKKIDIDFFDNEKKVFIRDIESIQPKWRIGRKMLEEAIESLEVEDSKRKELLRIFNEIEATTFV